MKRRALQVVHPLDHTPEHNRPADACCEQHRAPGEQRKLRLGVYIAQFDLPYIAKHDVEHKAQRSDAHGEIEHAKVSGHEALRCHHPDAAHLWKQYERKRHCK